MSEIKVIVDDEGHDVDVVFEENIDVGDGGDIVKEIVVVDIMQMIATQDNTSFVDLSKRYINGEIAIIGNAIGKNIIVSNIECTGEDEYAWTAILSNWLMGENQDLSHADIAVFGIENKNGVLSLGSRTIPVSEILTINEMRNLPKYFTLTDEEMAKWCGMIGAVKQVEFSKYTTLQGSDEGFSARAYVKDFYGNENTIPVSQQGKTWTLVIRDGSGNFQVQDPRLPYHCANVRYVTNLPDYFTPTDDEKAKWRRMIGTTKLWKHTIEIGDGHLIVFTTNKTPYTKDNIGTIGSDYIFAKYEDCQITQLWSFNGYLSFGVIWGTGLTNEFAYNLDDYSMTDTVTEL